MPIDPVTFQTGITALQGLGTSGIGGSTPPSSAIGPSGDITVTPIALNLGEIMKPFKTSPQNGGGGFFLPSRLSQPSSGFTPASDVFTTGNNGKKFIPIIIAGGAGFLLFKLLKR